MTHTSKSMKDYAEGAILRYEEQILRSTSEARIEKLTARRDGWIKAWERETGRDWNKVIGSVEDLKEALPSLRIFEVASFTETFRKGEK